jgi:Uma2 family endonuclease
VANTPIPLRRWRRVEYERMVERGIFRPDDRVELLDGLLVVKEPQDSSHATCVALVAEALSVAFGPGWHVRQGAPVALDRWSEPEPDVYVVPGSPRDYRDAHPTRPVLIVEVSFSRLRFDRTRKASAYARAGITDYWIVDVRGRALEVHREPARPSRVTQRWRYRSVERLGADGTVSPLAAPVARIAVADLLP